MHEVYFTTDKANQDDYMSERNAARTRLVAIEIPSYAGEDMLPKFEPEGLCQWDAIKSFISRPTSWDTLSM
jgi:hypothetical protein